MKRIFLTFFTALASLLAPAAVFAIVNVTENFTITLPSDSSTYTVKSGGSFNNLSVAGAAFVFTLDPKDQVIIISSARKSLSNDQSVEAICTSDESRIIYAVATSSSQTAFTTTPSGTCTLPTTQASTGSGGSGGGGGGGGGGSVSSSPTTTTTTTSTSTPAATTTSPTIPAPSTQASSVIASTPAVSSGNIPPSISKAALVSPVIILRTVAMGSRGNDITALQKFLASDPSVYPEGIVSGYFGAKTKAAIQRFQEKYNIAKKGQQGYGVLGPKTKEKLKELSSKPISSPSASASAPAPSSTTISAMQAQIKALQDMINKLKLKQKK